MGVVMYPAGDFDKHGATNNPPMYPPQPNPPVPGYPAGYGVPPQYPASPAFGAPSYAGPGYSGPGSSGTPPPRRSGRANTVVAVSVVIGVVGLAVVTGLFQSGVLPLNSEPMAIPEVGDCYADKEIFLYLHGPMETVSCTNPAAHRKVTESAIVTGSDIVVECAKREYLVITQGRHYGKTSTAHSCAEPNLIEGNCYDAFYLYDRTCTGTGARFDRVLPGVMDTDECEPELENPADQMTWIPAGIMHFIDEGQQATYCFVPNRH